MGRFIDVSDLQQKMIDLQNSGVTQQQQSGQRRKKGGRSNLITYDADLMEFKNSFIMGDDGGLSREYSNYSQRSPTSRGDNQSYYRFSNGGESPTVLRTDNDILKLNNNDTAKGDDEEDKRSIPSPGKKRNSGVLLKQDISIDKGRKQTDQKEKASPEPTNRTNEKPQEGDVKGTADFELWTRGNTLNISW